MKIRESNLGLSLLSETTQDKQKKARTKSPNAAITKSKQAYLQNLEKKLDEFLTVSTTDKRVSSIMQNRPGTSDLTQSIRGAQNFESYKDFKGKKKVQLCKMWAALKTCKNSTACPFAHGVKELDVEYKPTEWVKIFRQPSAHGLRTIGVHTTKNQPKDLSEFSRVQTPNYMNRARSPKEKGPDRLDKVINTKGRTLLIEATVTNDLSSVKALVNKGASVSQKDWLGNNSIVYAIKGSNPIILEALIKGSHEVLDLNEQFTINKFSYLILASKMGNAKMIEVLLNYGAKADVSDRYNRTALFYCVEKGFKDGVELMLSASVDVNRVDTYGKTALDYAYDKKLIEILDILIRAGGASDDPTKNKMLLLTCAQYNLKESMFELLKRSLPLNETDENGNNLLMVAYECGNIALLEDVIREYGLQKALNQRNKRGDNLILRSVKDQNEPLTHFLIENPWIEINAKDEMGKSIMMYAAESGDYHTVEVLISKGINLDATDKYGRTTLMYACKSDNPLVVEVILRNTVNATWKDSLGNSARHYAHGHLVRGLLRHYMIDKNQLSESLIKELEDEAYQTRK